jgi:hypothetical protein
VAREQPLEGADRLLGRGLERERAAVQRLGFVAGGARREAHGGAVLARGVTEARVGLVQHRERFVTALRLGVDGEGGLEGVDRVVPGLALHGGSAQARPHREPGGGGQRVPAE